MSELHDCAKPLARRQAALLQRLGAEGDTALLAEAITALAEAREQGHVCLDLGAWQRAPDAASRDDATATHKALLETGMVAEAPAVTDEAAQHDTLQAPLVLDAAGRLYTLRDFRAERRIAAFFQQRLARPSDDPADLEATLQQLGLLHPTRDADTTDWQLVAVVAGATRSLTVLCGGPGTGKTTTVTRLLSVLLSRQPDLRVAVAAPTGKAAARLGEALAARSRELPVLAQALHGLEPRTLHRLLGYRPHDDTFRYGTRTDARLPYDVVVVDEASMVDPAVFAELCTALEPDTRLILVGDKDQLAAVAAGQVLGDLTATARPELGVGPALAADVARATGCEPPRQTDAAPIADATVLLWVNHRSGAQPGISNFAASLMRRQPDDALATFEAGHDDLRREADLPAALDVFVPQLLHMFEAATSGDAERALAAVPHARILCAQRLGPHGAQQCNRRVERLLRERGLLAAAANDPFYIGRPILVTANDQQNRVWNGDLGVIGRDASGRAVVWLRDSDGTVRALNPRRLPAHETAWAMTVHKAQGSEFDHVLLVMPEHDGPLLHAALIYTGVTRARHRATVVADAELLRVGLARWPERRSGLSAALGGR